MKKYQKPIIELITFLADENIMDGQTGDGPSTEQGGGMSPFSLEIDKVGL